MSLRDRIDKLEAKVFGDDDDDGPLQLEFCNWTPAESPPDVPHGVVLTPASWRRRNELLSVDESIPYCE